MYIIWWKKWWIENAETAKLQGIHNIVRISDEKLVNESGGDIYKSLDPF